MYGKKLLLVALSSTMLVGAAATASFAAPSDGQHGRGHHRPGMPPEVIYVRMLKQFDTNGDMKITKEELQIGVDKVFDQIDTNKDGQITPAELKTYRQDRAKAWRDEHKKQEDAQNSDQGDKDKQADKDKGHEHGHKHHGGPHDRAKGQERMMWSLLFFHRVDTDGNGQISKAEAEAAANKMFDRLDRNHDGVISLDDMPNRPLI